MKNTFRMINFVFMNKIDAKKVNKLEFIVKSGMHSQKYQRKAF